MHEASLYTAQLRIGDRVTYRGAWGSGPAEPGRITGTGEKNGRDVYDVLLDDGRQHWGYRDQFEAVPC